MLNQDDLWLVEDALLLDEPGDAQLTMEEVRQLVEPDRRRDDLGLRSILERPEALSQAWRRCEYVKGRRRTPKRARRRVRAQRAA